MEPESEQNSRSKNLFLGNTVDRKMCKMTLMMMQLAKSRTWEIHWLIPPFHPPTNNLSGNKNGDGEEPID